MTGVTELWRLGRYAPGMRDFSEAPFLVIWEVTQACDLACLHCRASALPRRHPSELTTEEGYGLLEQIRDLGDPLMVFTGGDPLKRPDLFALLARSVALKLRTTVTPSATALLTPEAIIRFRATGVARMALSLDGPDAASHDGFRRVPGSFDRTLAALKQAREAGLDTQINTTVTRHNADRLEEIATLVERAGARLWSVFYLVATGRASAEDDLNAEEYERTFQFLYNLSSRARFDIKTTEAQHYRRYVAQRRKSEGATARTGFPAEFIGRQTGINDGKGLLFVSHTGEIFPSGFLPISQGNIRRNALAEVYRNAPLFRALRDSSRLRGKCGVCEFRNLCGGSRARAYALNGDCFAEDPRCIFSPVGTRPAASVA